MRVVVVGAALCGLAATLCGCVATYGAGSDRIAVARVDPQEAAERAVIGAAAGTALGTGLGATFAINPAIGAVVGAETGATLGAAIGVLTAQPLPSYGPVVVPVEAAVPQFYDTWPPGDHPPPVASGTPPPPG